MKVLKLFILFFSAAICQAQSTKVEIDYGKDSIAPFNLEKAKLQIKALEYHVSYDSITGTYQSPNRNQGLRSRYLSNNWVLESRNPKQIDAINSKIAFLGLGNGKNKFIRTPRQSIKLKENTIIGYYDKYSIEYKNLSEGIKQSITVNERVNEESLLYFKFQIQGLEIDFKNEAIHFIDNNNRPRLQYDQWLAFDANGMKLECHMEIVNKNEWQLVVNQENAQFPITLDPTIQNISPTSSWLYGKFQNSVSGSELGMSMAKFEGKSNSRGFLSATRPYIGAPKFDKGQFNEGAVFNVNEFNFDTSNNLVLIGESNKTGALLGSSIGFSCLSVDNVGPLLSMIVGAEGYSNGQQEEGAIYIYTQPTRAFLYWIQGPNTLSEIIESNVVGAHFGHAVIGTGDLNADLFEDLAVGAPDYTNGEVEEGSVMIFYGDSTGIDTSRMITLESNQDSAHFGQDLTSGDFSRDGWSDLVVAAPAFDHGQLNEGAVFIYNGSNNGIDSSSRTMLLSNNSKSNFGKSIANAKDVNGDGYDDLLIGAPSYSTFTKKIWQGGWLIGGGWQRYGACFLYYGGINGISTTLKDTIFPNDYCREFGLKVESCGDIDLDGYDDFAVLQRKEFLQDTDQIRIFYGDSLGHDTSRNIVIRQENIFNMKKVGDHLLVASHDNSTTPSQYINIYRFNDKGIIDNRYTNVFQNPQNSLFDCVVTGDVNGDGFKDILFSYAFSDGVYSYGFNKEHYGSSNRFLEEPSAYSFLWNVIDYIIYLLEM